jgi:hypothetical protein
VWWADFLFRVDCERSRPFGFFEEVLVSVGMVVVLWGEASPSLLVVLSWEVFWSWVLADADWGLGGRPVVVVRGLVVAGEVVVLRPVLVWRRVEVLREVVDS